jgi:hypothetical protein
LIAKAAKNAKKINNASKGGLNHLKELSGLGINTGIGETSTVARTLI